MKMPSMLRLSLKGRHTWLALVVLVSPLVALGLASGLSWVPTPEISVLAADTLRLQNPQQPAPTFRVEINYVNVDVGVTDEQGRFVRDLGQDDFEVYEDGKRQQLSTFSLVDIPIESPRTMTPPSEADVAPDVQSNAPDSGSRVYIILLDDLHVDPLRSARAKGVARQFVERHLGPNDLAAVLHTSGRANASQGFTTDRRLLLQAIDRFQGMKLRSSVLERLDEYQRRQEEETKADLRLQRVFDPLDAERADRTKRMLSTLTNLGDLLASAKNRRKAMLLVSEGLDYALQMDIAQTTSGLSTFTNSSAPDVRSAFQRSIRAAARANVSIYAVDPRGLAGTGDQLIEVSSFPENPHLGLTPTTFLDEVRQAQDTLRTLSDETGGLASVTSNDFANVFERLVRDNSTYYMLGYYSSNERRDGRYRKISVKVKRQGVRVRARSGYAV